MRKGISIGLMGLSVVVASGILVGFSGDKKSLDFIAPSVTTTTEVDNDEIGMIVYDANLKTFQGVTENGWQPLASGSGSINNTSCVDGSSFSPADGDTIFCNPGATNFDIKLGQGYSKGSKVTIVNESSGYSITVQANDSNTIRTVYPNSAATLIVINDGTSLPNTPSDWQGIGVVASEWQSSTISANWGANCSVTSQYRRLGDSYEVKGQLACTGDASGGSLTITLPFTIDTAKIPSTTNYNFGTATARDTSATKITQGYLKYVTSTTLYVQLGYIGGIDFNDEHTSADSENQPFAWGTSDVLSFEFTVPVSGLSATKG